MSKKTIWCLNMASAILDSHTQEIIDKFGKDKICFGNRHTYDAPVFKYLNTDSPLNLMPGIEYFVPIVPKCLGSRLFKSPSLYIKGIADYYTSLGQQNYEYFWGDECHKKGYRMITPQFKGYFDILKETAPNILIGYSQGGLVSKYLAWLDEKVFQTGYVDSVITISSPNFGSPLANPNNKSNVLQCLLKIAAVILFEMPVAHNLFIEMIEKRNVDKRISLDDVNLDIVHSIVDDIIDILDEKFDDRFKELKELLDTLNNWLGGLRKDPDNAFIDLNIFNLCKPYSVLTSINSSSGIHQKSIISANHSLKDFLPPEAKAKVNKVLRKRLLSENFFLRILQYILQLIGFLHASQEKGLKKIEDIINTEMMVEQYPGTPVDDRIKGRIGEYQDGIKSLSLPANSHDFVIPSAYQLTMKNNIASKDINKVNFKANHRTGSNSDKYAAGRENYQIVLKLLEEII